MHRNIYATLAALAVALQASPALALAPPTGQGGGMGGFLASFMPIIVIFAIFYFMLILPQQKKAKEHKAMLEALKKGDKVLTQGGIYGLVEQVSETTVTLKIAENTKVKFRREYIASLRGGDEAE